MWCTWILLAILAIGSQVAHAEEEDAVETWTMFVKNVVMEEIDEHISVDLDSVAAARVFSMLHISMHDAYHCIQPFNANGPLMVANTTNVPCDSPADPVAAANYAAFTVVSIVWPNATSLATELLTTQLARLTSSTTEIENGKAIGEEVALAVLDSRSHDGWLEAAVTNRTIITGSNEPGAWRPTPPAYGAFVSAGFASVQPISAPSLDLFDAPPPPALNSSEYTRSYKQVLSKGFVNSTTRTADEFEALQFWLDKNAANRWFDLVHYIAHIFNTSLEENLEMFASISMSQFESTLASFYAKVKYLRWRPTSAIWHADIDGNSETIHNPNWLPYLHPEATADYISTVACTCAGSGKAIANWLGTDNLTIVLDGRQFYNISSMIHECGMSRVWAGGHFGYSVEAGFEVGMKVADYIHTYKFGHGTPVTITLPPVVPEIIDEPQPPSTDKSQSTNKKRISDAAAVGITIMVVILVIVIVVAVLFVTPLGKMLREKIRGQPAEVN